MCQYHRRPTLTITPFPYKTVIPYLSTYTGDNPRAKALHTDGQTIIPSTLLLQQLLLTTKLLLLSKPTYFDFANKVSLLFRIFAVLGVTL